MSYITQGKVCSCCGQFKEADQFHVDSRKKSGLASQCKQCRGVKGEPRRTSTPVIRPDIWIMAFLYEKSCIICEGQDVGLYVDGVQILNAETVDQAKAMARRGMILCDRCKGDLPKTIKQKMRQKRHMERIDELLNTADTMADLLMKARTNKRVAELIDNHEIDHVYVQNVAFEKILQRNDRTAEKREAYPILTTEKVETIARRETKYGLFQDLID